MSSPTEKKPSYLSYQSPLSELSSKELRFGSWYVQHKIAINKAVTFSLFVIGFFTNLFGIIFWGKYIMFDFFDDRTMLSNLATTGINYEVVKDRLSAKPLTPVRTDIFDSAPGKYDISTIVTNPNPFHYAIVTFHHTAGDAQNEQSTLTVLPGKTVPLTSFGVSSPSYPAGTNLVIDTIQWKRINRHRIPDPTAYMEQRLQFDTTDVTFLPKNSIEDVPTHKLTFLLTNASPYSYWEPLFVVQLFNGNETGHLRLVVPELKAGETRTIDLRSLAEGLSATEIELVPVFNIFDPNAYIAPAS